jgi:hypothetical protein
MNAQIGKRPDLMAYLGSIYAAQLEKSRSTADTAVIPTEFRDILVKFRFHFSRTDVGEKERDASNSQDELDSDDQATDK